MATGFESGRRWKIGELAAATRLTVRTLHHYEQIGLLAPATRTSGAQRIYDARDVRRLYRVLALRDLGLPLARIRSMLGGAGLADVLRAHLAGVEAELARLQRLRRQLAHACAHSDRDPDLLATLEAMGQVARHIDARARPARPRAARWRALGKQLRARMMAGDEPSAPRVRAIAAKVLAQLNEFAGGDRATLDALAHLRQFAFPKELAGWDPALARYLDRALDHLRPEESR